MILLEHVNRIIEETLKDRFEATKHVTIDMTCADFDGVQFHVWSNKDKKSEVNISIKLKNGKELQKYGVTEKIRQIYGSLVSSTEPDYDFTLRVDAEQLGNQKKDDLARKIALFKRHVFAAPFDFVFDGVEKGQSSGMIDWAYRGTNERIFIKPEGKDRCTIMFSINFKDPDDIIFGKVFLSEFQKSIGGAPSVSFTQRDPPAELRGVKGLTTDGSQSYVTFVLFDRHFAKEKRAKTIDTIQTFRNYLHYHIKCSKSHLHTRMRNRVDLLLKILNRAKQDLPTEKKTASGRTFTRKDKK